MLILLPDRKAALVEVAKAERQTSKKAGLPTLLPPLGPVAQPVSAVAPLISEGTRSR